MGVEGCPSRLEGGNLSFQFHDGGEEGAEDGDHRGLPKGDSFDVGWGHNWEDRSGEVRCKFPGTGYQVDEGPDGLIMGEGGHHSFGKK